MKIREFGVEIWMNRHETQCRYNLAETCVESLTLGELMEIAGQGGTMPPELTAMQLTYGAIEGSERLRRAIAALYDRQAPDDILVTHGAIGANALVYQALVEAGDRVVSILPTYQQHHSIPESLGAEIASLRLRREDDYRLDLDELRRLCAGGIRLISLANPNNPTGALLDRQALEAVAAIAREHGAHVLCDEVYRGLDQHGDGKTASIADLYEKGISTGSMSKAWSLAGLRLGWMAGPADVLAKAMIHRDYNTISVGMIDDYFATLALEHGEAIMARNRAITRGNLATLSDWIGAEPATGWVKPQSGTTALLHYDHAMASAEFCERLLDETGVLLVPGSAFDMEGCLRIGYANNPAILRQGLAAMSDFLTRLGAVQG